jgi:hypothetical protein
VHVRALLLAALVALPVVLAFFEGGYFDKPRLWAGLASCALVVAAALASRRPLPASTPGRLALGGLALLAAWTALSVTWAPLSTPAIADANRLLLYLAFFTAALALLDSRVAIRVLEPAIALGSLAVILYGLSERLLPGVFELARDASALGRLSRPLTYWNAMGALAAIGVVLAVRLAGDRARPTWMRCAAAAGSAPLALGVYLSFSRGALAALALGLVLLALLARDRAQLRTLALLVPAGVLVAAAAGLLDGVRTLDGDAGQGAIMLVALVAVAAAAALVQRRLCARESGVFRAGGVALDRRSRTLIAAGFVALAIAAFAVAALVDERRRAPAGATAARLTSIESNRYEYWPVALRAFGDDPLKGLGTGGYQVAWLRERPIPEGAFDAHSLYLETAAELGLVGLLALGLFLGGGAWAAVRAQARDPVAAAGLTAAGAVFLVHAGLDWLWEMPAVSLPALLLAAGLARLAEAPTVAAAPAAS